MNWKEGQNIAALCDVSVFKMDGTFIEKIIEFDKVYSIKTIESACCMNLLNLGFINKEKHSGLIYECEKCHKTYLFKENETILFHETWFRPIDNSESMLEMLYRKVKDKFRKKQSDESFIKVPIKPLRPNVIKTPPIIEIPAKEPRREEELV